MGEPMSTNHTGGTAVIEGVVVARDSRDTHRDIIAIRRPDADGTVPAPELIVSAAHTRSVKENAMAVRALTRAVYLVAGCLVLLAAVIAGAAWLTSR
jgi:hypothetical protein